MSSIDDLAGMQSGDPSPFDAAEHLQAMWGLPDVGVRIAGARITGHGRDAAGEVFLSNGETMVFEHLSDIVGGNALMAELAACAGVAVALKPVQKAKSIVWIRALAERLAADTADTLARDWGSEFLGTAQQVEVDMADQAQRWACFVRLRGTDPWALAKESGCAFARQMLVPADLSGVRYVRAGWFQSFVRQFDGTVSAGHVLSRMLRVGWQRRGKQGLVGARRPDLPGFMSIRFLLVPPKWEDFEETEEGELISADIRPTREKSDASRARDICNNSGYQSGGLTSGGAP